MDRSSPVSIHCTLDQPLEDILTYPNPYNYREKIFNAKSKKERDRLIFEWTQKGPGPLWQNMDQEHREQYLDIKEKYL